MNPLTLIVASLVVSALPVIIGIATAYLKVSIVFGMLRTALGAQHVPSNLVISILSIAISFLVMQSVIIEISTKLDTATLKAIIEKPSEENINKLINALNPIKVFLHKHSGSVEIQAVAAIQDQSLQKSDDAQKEVTWSSSIPSFVLTELKESFAMAFLLLIPFLAIDLVISNLLVGLGMTMVSPIIITLPLKLALFVATDGWLLLTHSMTKSYGISV